MYQVRIVKINKHSEVAVFIHGSRTYYRCLTEVTIVGSDVKLIHFIPNHVVETTVLISRVVVDIIEACSFSILKINFRDPTSANQTQCDTQIG